MLGSEADHGLVRTAPGRHAGDDVGGRLETDAEALAALPRELVVGGLCRAEVRGSGGHDQNIGAREALAHRGLELSRRLDGNGRRGQRKRHVRRDQRHVGTATRCLLCERKTHAAGGAVADVAHGVDRLSGAAGRDQHPHAVE
jgi:hypothetical protein